MVRTVNPGRERIFTGVQVGNPTRRFARTGERAGNQGSRRFARSGEQADRDRTGSCAGREERRARRPSMSLRTVLFMFFIIAAMTALLLYYIKLQADVTRTSREIAELEQNLTQMKAENDADYNEINDSMSLEEIRDRAIHELGMKYADRDQVIIYSGSEKDIVHQVTEAEGR